MDFFKRSMSRRTHLSNIEAKLFILYGRFDTQTSLSLLMMLTVVVCY